jgi:hypothetical protein
MSLGAFAPVLERIEQLRVQARQARQILGIYLVRFALV